ncbi:unsaturated rhamnogalacturonyl hydrolase [Butyrivibrio fibrisolvens DSM 3071]|uniref:Unsaturated rhamnogalacturonyl hydrolase n=1 Tax=Butyrivibrio fibrisolvens DSM 3071 TaxID=1121131 RepID=A0A1M6BS03_BUTFI|nr:glycoside hydrolase family 88 protein [Butyrivibrio fibrisolvens]SHI51560.1 unsaturated rhamnogalacturonyl hydrolase [Butyrivibrio fibrisolvens DSM 3071]
MDRNETITMLNEYVDMLMARSDAEHPMWNIEKILGGKPNKWNYIDGCMITSLLNLYDISGDKKYLDFADKFLGWFVNEDGSIKTYSAEEYNIDNVNSATCLFKLYDLTGKEKYRKAMDTVRAQLETMPRTKDGNFWHKKIYPNQVWLDGLYMAQPFYMEYERRYGSIEGCIDSFKQFRNVEKFMKDPETGLYYHGYDESREMYWADKDTGCSPNFWLRALGWFAASLVDVCEAAGDVCKDEQEHLHKMLGDLVEALIKYQDESGLFYDIVNLPDDTRNYLETSGTALISYAILKGTRLGYIDNKYREYGVKAFDGIADKYLGRNEDGTPKLSGICLVSGLGGASHRDGSLEYYFSEPVVENEAKGVGPFIYAYTELLRN